MSTLRLHRFEVAEPASSLRLHRFEVTVDAPAASSALRITRFEVNIAQPLVANAGGDLSEQPPLWPITLDGTRSTGSGTLIFEWSQVSGPTVTFDDATVSTPTFTSPALASGALLVFRLRVKDDSLTWSEYDQISVAVDPQQHWRATDTGWVASALSAA